MFYLRLMTSSHLLACQSADPSAVNMCHRIFFSRFGKKLVSPRALTTQRSGSNGPRVSWGAGWLPSLTTASHFDRPSYSNVKEPVCHLQNIKFIHLLNFPRGPNNLKEADSKTAFKTTTTLRKWFKTFNHTQDSSLDIENNGILMYGNILKH